jgi:formamidopyrimidine-DNA glycosylase
MPELPDVTVYVERLRALAGGKRLERLRIASPFVTRTFDPPIASLEGKRVVSVDRMAKRIVLGFEEDLFLAIHLMISGRLRWREVGHKVPKKVGLGAFDFENGTLLFTEQSSKKRASLHLFRGRAGLVVLDRGGIDPLAASVSELAEALRRENRTLKRALTDQRLIAGIGNAYSDEILFQAKLSPVKRTAQLSDEEIGRLHEALRETLNGFTERLRAEVADGFPETVTAFRDDMAVHGRYGQPCKVCAKPVQRIRYADNESNYCATCQTGGRLLADRGLSRLLRGDWPRSLEELEERMSGDTAPKKG